MANAVAARMYGDEYQALCFWKQVCRMLLPRSKISAVEIESADIKSLDDVVVHYDNLYENGRPLKADCYQVKFHMTAAGAFTWAGMMDPAFINAESVSLIQRLHHARLKHAPDGASVRFFVHSPWVVDPKDPLAELVELTDGHIRWDTLATGGDNSAMGKIRKAWREHIGVSNDDELRLTLLPIRIDRGDTLSRLRESLNEVLPSVGLKPVATGSQHNPYEGLARTFIMKGEPKRHTAKSIREICKENELLSASTSVGHDAIRLGVRSFLNFAETLEADVDHLLCFLKYFDGRKIRSPADWATRITPEICEFVRANVRAGGSYTLNIQAHSSIAFALGQAIGTKSGARLALVQRGMGGQMLWDLTDGTEGGGDNAVISTETLDGAQPDLAVCVSLSRDVRDDVIAYVRSNLPKVGRLLHFAPAQKGQYTVRNVAHAVQLCDQMTEGLRRERRGAGMIHLFVAAPQVFTFLIGRSSQMFGPWQFYEFDLESVKSGDYGPSIRSE